MGNDILIVENLTKSIDGVKVLDNVSFIVGRDDKIAFTGNDISVSTLFKILAGEMEADSGSYKYGVTITKGYFPRDNGDYFNGIDLNLVDWMRQYSEEKSESYLRGFLEECYSPEKKPLRKPMCFLVEKELDVCYQR